MKAGRERGFSLTELLASMAILGGTLLASFGLMDNALHVFGEVGASAGDPLVQVAQVALRRDVQRARLLPEVGPVSGGALRLELQDGREVEWRRQGEALVRVETGADRGVVEARVIPRRLTEWSWQPVSPDLLEVRVGVRCSPRARGLRQSTPPDLRPVFSTWVAHISPRGVPEGRAW